jgi:hypothetical protein
MNESEPNLSVQTDLMEQVVALRHQVFTLLLALVVVSGTVTAYLFIQDHRASNDLATVKPQAPQLKLFMDTFRRDEPNMTAFVNQLRAYGVTHADFQPILKKYGLTPQPLPAAAPVAPKK